MNYVADKVCLRKIGYMLNQIDNRDVYVMRFRIGEIYHQVEDQVWFQVHFTILGDV